MNDEEIEKQYINFDRKDFEREIEVRLNKLTTDIIHLKHLFFLFKTRGFE